MRKGQISFDFVFAAIAAIVVLQFLIGTGIGLGDSQENAAIASQARRIASELEMTENYSRLFDDLGAGSSVEYEIPMLKYIPENAGDPIELGCVVILSGDEIRITPDGWGEAIVVNANIEKIPGAGKACGGTITFTNAGAA